jgi:tetratricopeptide (TPR) repeat protein
MPIKTQIGRAESSIKEKLLSVANRLGGRLPVLRKRMDATAERYARIARTYYEDEDYQSAITNYEAALKWSPEDNEILNDLAQVYYENNSLKEAEYYFRKVLDHEYSNERALKGLAFTLHWSGKLDEAKYTYLRFLNLEKEDFDVLLNLGALFYDSGQYEQAVEYLQRAIQADPSGALAYQNLAGAYYNLGKIQEAEASVRRALELEPQVDSYRLLGLILETQQKTEEALANYEAAVAEDPLNGHARLELGRLNGRMGAHDKYLENAREAVRIFSEESDSDGLALAYWDLGWAYYELDDWRKSAEASAKALEINPGMTPPRFNLGLALLREHSEDKARKEYLVGLEKSKPSDLKNDAIDDLERALKEDPDMPGARDILKILEAEYAKLEQRTSISSPNSLAE